MKDRALDRGRVAKLERLKAFFQAAFIRRFIEENPALELRGPEPKQRPTLPFSQGDMTRILTAVEQYPDESGKMGRDNAIRLRAFIIVLRYTGIKNLFKQAKVSKAYAHRFRDTFSVELLLAGVPTVEVSILFGHSNIKITQKHYSPWVRDRQLLEADLERAWARDPVVQAQGEMSGRLRGQGRSLINQSCAKNAKGSGCGYMVVTPA